MTRRALLSPTFFVSQQQLVVGALNKIKYVNSLFKKGRSEREREKKETSAGSSSGI